MSAVAAPTVEVDVTENAAVEMKTNKRKMFTIGP